MAKYKNRKNNRVFVNKTIRAKKVRCINQDDKNLGVIATNEAIKIAKDVGLDLVQISNPKGNAPVCKILDYGKYKYELSKRRKEQAKKQRESVVKLKEIKFRPSTDAHDLQTKANKASKFIKDGCKVKIAIQFKGRELAHKDVAEDRFYEFFEMLDGEIDILNKPKMNGRTMVAILAAGKNVDKAS